MDKQETLDKFYTHYPQFKNLSFTGQEFSWLCIMRCNKWAMMNRQKNRNFRVKIRATQSSQQICAIHTDAACTNATKRNRKSV
jgi:ABC-2 type transport system permease protein